MPSDQQRDQVARVIDANANRFREGLRVVEEIARFVLNNADLTTKLKENRHAVGDLLGQLTLPQDMLLSARNSEGDVGLEEVFDGTSRTDCRDILRANMGRSQESCRVLEEFSKLLDESVAASFKRIRFDLYSLEKEILSELSKT